jgi:hypothetical protein
MRTPMTPPSSTVPGAVRVRPTALPTTAPIAMTSAPAVSRLSTLSIVALVIAAGLAVAGCSGAGHSTSTGDRNDVVGTWKYRATAGSDVLEEGIFEIRVRQGRLDGVLRDSRIGIVPVDVSYRGQRLEMRIDQIRIRGRVQNNRYTAFYERPLWDVTTSQSFRSRNDRINGSITARRIRSLAFTTPNLPLGCTNILEESTDRCN